MAYQQQVFGSHGAVGTSHGVGPSHSRAGPSHGFAAPLEEEEEEEEEDWDKKKTDDFWSQVEQDIEQEEARRMHLTAPRTTHWQVSIWTFRK